MVVFLGLNLNPPGSHPQAYRVASTVVASAGATAIYEQFIKASPPPPPPPPSPLDILNTSGLDPIFIVTTAKEQFRCKEGGRL